MDKVLVVWAGHCVLCETFAYKNPRVLIGSQTTMQDFPFLHRISLFTLLFYKEESSIIHWALSVCDILLELNFEHARSIPFTTRYFFTCVKDLYLLSTSKVPTSNVHKIMSLHKIINTMNR